MKIFLIIFALLIIFCQLVLSHGNHNDSLKPENLKMQQKASGLSSIKLNNGIELKPIESIIENKKSYHTDGNMTYETNTNQTITAKTTATLGIFLHKIHQYFEHHKSLLLGICALIISEPNVPAFILLSIIIKLLNLPQKDLMNKNSNNATFHKIYKSMICLSCGSILGHVFLHLLPYINEKAITQKYNAIENMHGDTTTINATTMASTTSVNSAATTTNTDEYEYMMIYIVILFGVMVFYSKYRVFGDMNDDDDDDDNEYEQIKNGKRKENNEVQSKSISKNPPNTNQNKPNSNSLRPIRTKIIVFLHLLDNFIHNMAYGLTLGVSFSLGIKVGISTLITLFLYSIPHEMADSAILIEKGYSISTIITSHLMMAFATLIGGTIGMNMRWFRDYLIGLITGGYLYVSLCKTIPEINEYSLKKNFLTILIDICFIGLGIYSMYIIAIIE